MEKRREPLRDLEKLAGGNTAVLGIGQTLKADDGAAPLICEKLKKEKITASVFNAASVPENYIQQIVKLAPENLIIIDAIDFNQKPGTVRLFELRDLQAFAFSTHTLSPHLFIDMIKQQIDVNVCIIGIQPETLQLNQPLSVPVKNAVQYVSEKLINIWKC